MLINKLIAQKKSISILINYINRFDMIFMLLTIVTVNSNIINTNCQSAGSSNSISITSTGDKTMEKFLDKLFHESVYNRRIRPFYTDTNSNWLNYFN